MLPDCELIQHSFYGGHDIQIYPIFDVHLGSPACMEQKFISFIETVAKTPNTYLVLGGDLLDNGVKNSVSSVYKNRYMPSEAKKMMAKILEPARDRILCLLPGNHELRSSKETDDEPVYDIAAKLDLEHLYRENACYVKIQLGRETTKNGKRSHGDVRPTYALVVQHGAGSGTKTGAAVNRAEDYGFTIDGMDALILGHSHKIFNTHPGKTVIDLRNNIVRETDFCVISATSWLKYAGYPVRGMMRPAPHRLTTIHLCGSHKEMLVTS